MNAYRSLPLLLLLALSACSASRRTGPPVEALLSEVPQPSAACEVIATPAALPAANLLIDSAAVRSRIREYVATIEPAPAGHVLLSMSYDSAGLNYRREVIEHATTAVVADSIQRFVFAGLREVEDGEELPWYVRLRLDLQGSEVVAMRVGRSELCPPVPRDASLESRLHTVASAGIRYREGRRERLIVVRLDVSTGGQVIGSTVMRGPLLTTDQQRSISDFVRRYSFQPATIDGRPVRGSIEIPVIIRG
jgi:hypothetical protein